MSSPPSDLTALPGNELPPVLALPLEIKQYVIAYLHDCTEPTLAILRRTHSSFYHIIPKSELRSAKLRAQLRTAEATYPYLLPPGHYTGLEFLRVLPRNSFSDNETCKRKGLGHSKAYLRFCLCCGVSKGLYGRNTKVPVRGVTTSACYSCGHFFFEVPFEEPLIVDCPEHLDHPAKLEGEIFQAKIDRLKARAEEDKAEAMDDWWYRNWARRGRVLQYDGEEDDDWLPDDTLPTPGQAENMPMLAYLELH